MCDCYFGQYELKKKSLVLASGYAETSKERTKEKTSSLSSKGFFVYLCIDESLYMFPLFKPIQKEYLRASA